MVTTQRSPDLPSPCGSKPLLGQLTIAPRNISENPESPPKKRLRKPQQKHVNQRPKVGDLTNPECCRNHVERVLKDDCYRLGDQQKKSSCDCFRYFKDDSGKANDKKFDPPSRAVARFVRLDYDHQMQAIATLGSDASRSTAGANMKGGLPVLNGTGRKAAIGPCPEIKICRYKLSKLLRCGRGILNNAARAAQNGAYADLGWQPLLPWPKKEGTKSDRWRDLKHGVVAMAFKNPSKAWIAQCLELIKEVGLEMTKKKKRPKKEMYLPYDQKVTKPHDYTTLQFYDAAAIGNLFPNFRSNVDKIRNLGHGSFGEFLRDSAKFPKFLKDVRNETVEEIKRNPAFLSKCISSSAEIVAAGQAEQLLEELENRMKKAAETEATAMEQIGENINKLAPGLTTKCQSPRSMKGAIKQSWSQLGTQKANEMLRKIQEAEKQTTTALLGFVVNLEKKCPTVFAGMLNAASFHGQADHQVRPACSSFCLLVCSITTN